VNSSSATEHTGILATELLWCIQFSPFQCPGSHKCEKAIECYTEHTGEFNYHANSLDNSNRTLLCLKCRHGDGRVRPMKLRNQAQLCFSQLNVPCVVKSVDIYGNNEWQVASVIVPTTAFRL
jgi:hypothetical protein